MKKGTRVAKVGGLLHETLARLIQRECQEPQMGLVTVVDVEVDSSLSRAKVFVTVFEDNKRETSLQLLQEAAGQLRTLLAQKVALRAVPELVFIHDDTVINGMRIEKLLNNEH